MGEENAYLSLSRDKSLPEGNGQMCWGGGGGKKRLRQKEKKKKLRSYLISISVKKNSNKLKKGWELGGESNVE